MPDFGDEMGEFALRKIIEASEQLVRWAVRRRRVGDAAEANRQRISDLGKAIEDGKAGEFDLTDGKPQFFRYDLPEGLTPEQHQHIVHEIIEPILEKHGLAHPQAYCLARDADGSDMVADDADAVGFMFEDGDGDPARAHMAIQEAQAEIMAYGPVMEKLGLDRPYVRVMGFGLLDQEQRREFADELRRALSKAKADAATVDVPVADAVLGTLGGDLTVDMSDPRTREAAGDAVRGLSEEWTARMRGEGRDVALMTVPSPAPASELGPESFDSVYRLYREIHAQIEADGYDCEARFRPDGTADFVFDAAKGSSAAEGSAVLEMTAVSFDADCTLMADLLRKEGIPFEREPGTVGDVGFRIPTASARRAAEMARRLSGSDMRQMGGQRFPNLDEFEAQAKRGTVPTGRAAGVPTEDEMREYVSRAERARAAQGARRTAERERRRRERTAVAEDGRVIPSWEEQQAHAMAAAEHMQRNGYVYSPDRARMGSDGRFQETSMPRFFRPSERRS